ncbi:hypothetical protein KPNIH7_16036 [Klebsiella pneumoniae subsp. pneumoniae KPNIH7]|nr:hypothetical protein KPNIH7_16036 [Klebsiella pneumoniae subsp. pneumoniae KPNIH7]
MKKTIVAVMVAASAVLSAQAMATNTAQVTVLGEVSDAAKEGANKQVISSQADSLIKISRIWADFFPQTHRISLFRLFFHHFWRYFRFLLRSLPLTYHLVHPKQVGQGE